MGNIFVPTRGYNKNEKVEIKGFSFSKHHVPKEMLRYGTTAIAIQTTKLLQSRPGPEIYVTRVYFPESKHYDTFFTKDLK